MDGLIQELFSKIGDFEDDLEFNRCISESEFDELINIISDMKFNLRAFENSFDRYLKKLGETVR